MKHKQTVKNTNERVSNTDEPSWPSNEQAVRGRVVPFRLHIQSNESDGSQRSDDLMSTLTLITVLIVTFWLVAVALNGLLVCAILVVGGLLGALLVLKMRSRSGPTPIVPNASKGHQSGLKKAA